MEKKPFSDSRWWDKLGIVPQEILDKSFPGNRDYDPEYCEYREAKN